MGFAKKLEGLLEQGRFCQDVVQNLAAAADASRIPAGRTKAKACCQLFLRSGEAVLLHLFTAAGRQQPLGEGGIVLLGSLPCFGTRQFWSLVLLLLLRLCNVLTFASGIKTTPQGLPFKRNTSRGCLMRGTELVSANNKVVFHRCVQRVPLYIFLEQRTCTYRVRNRTRSCVASG